MLSLSFDSFSNIDDIYRSSEEYTKDFIKSFNRLYNSSKYNLIAINNQFDYLENYINKIILLNNINEIDEDINKNSIEIKLNKKEIKFLENIFPNEIESPTDIYIRGIHPKYLKSINIKLIENKRKRKRKKEKFLSLN